MRNRHLTKRRGAERRGRGAEALAAWWLTLRGWRIVARNLRTPYSEVDIVAVRRGVCAVVEVKARASFEACEEAIDWSARRRLDLAGEWIAERPYARERGVRMDAIYVVGWRVRHVPDAWDHGD